VVILENSKGTTNLHKAYKLMYKWMWLVGFNHLI